MTIAGRLAALTLATLALAGCQPTAPDDAAFGQRVRAYLLSHPEVLQEVGQRLEAKQAEAEQAAVRKAEAMLPGLRATIERDPRDFVANPGGAVTVTEFYDYRCPHCVNIAPKVVALIRANPDVRFVFKEMPIFGPTSLHAALAALAVKAAGGDSIGLYEALMNAHGLDAAGIDRLARQKGAHPADLSAPPASARAQLAQTTALFTRLNLEGTPAFIVGDHIILGEDMAAVYDAVARARAKTPTAG